VRRYYASFSYRAGSWTKPRRVVAKVEWHPGELYPRVGYIVTNMTRPAERVVMSYNHRGTPEQWIKEGKNAVTWTRLSRDSFKANAGYDNFFCPIAHRCRMVRCCMSSSNL
jgi:hypothetical protein